MHIPIRLLMVVYLIFEISCGATINNLKHLSVGQRNLHQILYGMTIL